MKANVIYRADYAKRPNLPYPNAATRRQVLDKVLNFLLMAAIGAGVAAMLLLLLALAFLPASVQYPFVTGGVMIVSTLISVCIGEKVTKKELLAVGIAFLGILALTVIPF